MFDWSVITYNTPFWLTGILYTCLLTFVSCIVGTMMAVILVVLWRVEVKWVQWSVFGFVELFKSIPLLVLLVAIQYMLPILWSVWSLSAFWNSVIAFSLSLSAFLAEVLRGGMVAIPKGHIEAAQALGISWLTIIRRVIIPETIRRSFTSIVVQYITVLKFSTLASVIGVPELLFSASMVNIQSVRPVEVYASLTLAFVALVLPLSLTGRYVEKLKWITLNPKSK